MSKYFVRYNGENGEIKFAILKVTNLENFIVHNNKSIQL